jgi:alpha-methylacyl-CoA racemase
VLGMGEAPEDEHLRARGTFVDVGGVIQPAPAPRLARSESPVPGPPRPPGGDTRRVLAGLGYGDDEIGRLIDCGAVR